jgi:hypothetical protein
LNLSAVAGAYVSAINPWIIGAVKVSTGSTVAADGSVAPNFSTFPNQRFQVQPLSPGEIRQAEFLNLQGVMRSVWMNGNIEGLDRPAGKGGDLLLFNSSTWLVTMPSEQWDANGWTHVVCTLQNS